MRYFQFAMIVRVCMIAASFCGPAAGQAIDDAATADSAAGLAFFETKIRPVLIEQCYSCHSSQADELQAGLLVDSRAGLLRGGDSGPAVARGKPGESLLIQSLHYDAYEMPPAGKLPAAVIADFERWVEIGMPDPRSDKAAAPATAIDMEEGRRFWAFQAIEPREPPPVANDVGNLRRVDRFLLAKLDEHALEPAPEADRATWLRRVTFDLIGLPPTIEQLNEFLGDESSQAIARVVDGLLASPHFGERWGRHWLDVARFAESSGGGRTIVFNDAWRYRDYVIDSVNRDKPLDRFIVEQIAGDLLPHATAAEEHEHLVATAYLLLGAHNYEEQDKRALEMDVVDEQLDTIGRGLLGMTVACARCHDHKFDPIPTADYYALAGILRSTRTLIHENVSRWTTQALPMLSDHDVAAVRAYDAALADTERKLAEAKQQPPGAKRKKSLAALNKKLAALKKRGSPAPTAMAVEDAEAIEDCKICIRGSVRHRGPAVPRGVMQVAVLGNPPQMPAGQSGRRELAEWIASPRNPLTARVYVNRVWHYLFGAGLVRTLDNFGTTGERPSHPELLDDLAARFMQDGWSTKRLIRELVMSRAYRMSTRMNVEAAAIDPENRLLWRMNRRRLDAESIRDAMLVVSGRLDPHLGGPNILDANVLAQQKSDMPTEYGYVFADTRRSVYTPAFRNRVHELFEVFDFAGQNGAVAERNVTTVVPQALLMLNSAFVMEQAKWAAERSLAISDLTEPQRIELAFREALGRVPSREEASIALAAVTLPAEEQLDDDVAGARRAAWEMLFQSLFGCIDFRYLE
jgi:mono/diheme cytochrome c family protein/cytochrome c553